MLHMKKFTCTIVAPVLTILAALPALGDTVAPVGAAQWNTWATATGIRTAGFWDGGSDDGTSCNLGYWLTGTNGSCANVAGSGFFGPRPGALPFLSAAGSPQTPVPFTLNPTGSTRTITLRLEVAGFRDVNTFGYYLLSNPGVLIPLFTGPDGPGATNAFTPTGPFAFYLQNGNGILFTSQNNLNFVLLSQDPSAPTLASNLLHYWIGVEDRPVPPGPYTTSFLPNGIDADYNDMLISIEVASSATGCTLTQGGYKNNFNSKLLNSPGFILGTRFYTPSELNQIIQNNAVKGNGLTSLAHQLITAKLNIFYGAVPPATVLNAITAADALIGSLIVPPLAGAGFLSPDQTSALTTTLDNFNNGLIGPPHCQ